MDERFIKRKDIKLFYNRYTYKFIFSLQRDTYQDEETTKEVWYNDEDRELCENMENYLKRICDTEDCWMRKGSSFYLTNSWDASRLKMMFDDKIVRIEESKVKSV